MSSRPKRILVVANETVAGRALRRELLARADGCAAEVLVVCPALNSRLRHWLSDEDRARLDAERRLEASLGALAGLGVVARGLIGDADPLVAVEDALRGFAAEELVVSTHPPGRSNWLERDVARRCAERFLLPVTHIVVDLEREGRAAA